MLQWVFCPSANLSSANTVNPITAQIKLIDSPAIQQFKPIQWLVYVRFIWTAKIIGKQRKYSSGNGNVHCHFCRADNHTNDINRKTKTEKQIQMYGVHKKKIISHCIIHDLDLVRFGSVGDSCSTKNEAKWKKKRRENSNYEWIMKLIESQVSCDINARWSICDERINMNSVHWPRFM